MTVSSSTARPRRCYAMLTAWAAWPLRQFATLTNINGILSAADFSVI